MKTKAALEVLLVNAQGIKHTNVLGKPAYYVIIECGNHVYKSKISSGKDDLKACWNEKITLEFPILEWKRLTYLKFRIMDKELFSQTGFVGQTIIHLGGIITEGCDKGFLEIKPVPYNVVLEDDSYKGEIRIGLKFITDITDVPNKAARGNTINEENKHSVGRSRIVKFWNIFWWWSWFFPKKTIN